MSRALFPQRNLLIVFPMNSGHHSLSRFLPLISLSKVDSLALLGFLMPEPSNSLEMSSGSS